jgi:serine protease Do
VRNLVPGTLLVIFLASTAGGDAPVITRVDPADSIGAALQLAVSLEGDGSYGAGILIDPPAGLVLTSHHVIEEMTAPRATSYDGRGGVATVVARDRIADLALLSVPNLRSPNLAAPRFADPASLRPGDEVFAIGSPRRLPFTVSRGIVSYVGREMEGARYLQLDMAINDGNSGGPVLTRKGEIAGVMSFILRRSQGLAFALPMSYAVTAFPGRVRSSSTVHASALPAVD